VRKVIEEQLLALVFIEQRCVHVRWTCTARSRNGRRGLEFCKIRRAGEHR
jgi:hypothetical protein